MIIYSYRLDRNGLHVKQYDCHPIDTRRNIVFNEGLRAFNLNKLGVVLSKNKIYFADEPHLEEAVQKLTEARKEILAGLEKQIEQEKELQRILQEALEADRNGKS